LIVRRLILLLAAAVAFAACSGVCVIALAFAFYALTVPYLGVAGTSGALAAAAALLMALIALSLVLAARAKPAHKAPPTPAKLIDRAIQLIREKPVMTIVGAIATGLLVVRDPKYLGAAMRAFIEGRETRRR